MFFGLTIYYLIIIDQPAGMNGGLVCTIIGQDIQF